MMSEESLEGREWVRELAEKHGLEYSEGLLDLVREAYETGFEECKSTVQEGFRKLVDLF